MSDLKDGRVALVEQRRQQQRWVRGNVAVILSDAVPPITEEKRNWICERISEYWKSTRWYMIWNLNGFKDSSHRKSSKAKEAKSCLLIFLGAHGAR